MEDFLKQLLQIGLFAAFIHAIIEVIKGICVRGIWGIVKEVALAIFKNKWLSAETMKALNFGLALLYCYAFDYGAMTKMLGITIEDTNNLAWWLDYAGTASVVYVGVDVFYGWVKKMRGSLNGNGAGKPAETITAGV